MPSRVISGVRLMNLSRAEQDHIRTGQISCHGVGRGSESELHIPGNQRRSGEGAALEIKQLDIQIVFLKESCLLSDQSGLFTEIDVIVIPCLVTRIIGCSYGRRSRDSSLR